MTPVRGPRALAVAGAAVVLVTASVVAITTLTSASPEAVACTITDSVLTCPLPSAPTATVTATVTVTSTPSTTTTTTPATSTTTSPTSTTTTTASTGCATRPNATNTGAQGTLANYTGPTTITTAGTVIQNVRVSGGLSIQAANVTIRNVAVDGISITRAAGTRISNVTTSGIYSSSGGDLVIDRTNIGFTSGGDAMHVTSDNGIHIVGFTLTNSWIHDPRPGPAEHWDGIQVRGADNSLIQCNSFDLGNWTSPINSSIYFEDANGGNSNYRIDKNWLNGGGFTLYLGHHGAGPAEVTNNVFGSNVGYGYCFDSANIGWLPTLMRSNTTTGGTALDPICIDR